LKPTAAYSGTSAAAISLKSAMSTQKFSWSFAEIAKHTSGFAGSSIAFAGACAVILLWAITGPLFGFSDTWQLIINTGTTIVTFLMVFLVQNTQNRDARALHLKLDELLRSLDAARNRLIDLENCTIEQIERQFRALKTRQERQVRNGIATPGG
jgi:low affinity Fe/Cu permease